MVSDFDIYTHTGFLHYGSIIFGVLHLILQRTKVFDRSDRKRKILLYLLNKRV